MKSKTRFFYLTLAGALFCALMAACAAAPAANSAGPAASNASPEADLDTAIRAASDYLNQQLPQGNKLVILNVQSEFPALSEYIIDELIANTVNDRIFSVVDRQQLNTIRAELEFHTSGEVSDESAQSIGQMLGAQVIISGAISRIGDLYRLRVRALTVQSAQIAGQFNQNIANGPTISALAQSQATGYGEASGGSAARPSVQTPAAAQTPAPAPEAPAITYKIGDEGPAGGIVFYDKGVVTNGWRYLEAAPNDIGPAQWGARGTSISGISTAVGTGRANTQRIVPELERAGEDGAALLCASLNINGHTGWFLPSKDELNLMYVNLKAKGLGRFGNGRYWASSQASDNWASNYAWVQSFSDGSQSTWDYNSSPGGKNNTYSIRAVRQF